MVEMIFDWSDSDDAGPSIWKHETEDLELAEPDGEVIEDVRDAIVPVALDVAVQVELRGLTGESAQYNWRRGEIERYFKEEKLYTVRLSDGAAVDVPHDKLAPLETGALRQDAWVRVMLGEAGYVDGVCEMWDVGSRRWMVRITGCWELHPVENRYLRLLKPDPNALHPSFCHPFFWPALSQSWGDRNNEETLLKLKRLEPIANSNAEGFAQRLKKLRARGRIMVLLARIQDPILKKFGMPTGQQGIEMCGFEMARRAKLDGSDSAALFFAKTMEGLGLAEMSTPEEAVAKMEKEAKIREMLERFAIAPPEILAPLTKAMALPADTTPDQLALQFSHLDWHAEAMARRQLEVARLSGEGGGEEHAHFQALRDSAAACLRDLFNRVLRPVEFYTSEAALWRCDWAQSLVEQRHAEALWGPLASLAGNPEKGFVVMDDALGGPLASAACSELARFESGDQLVTSNNLCNAGARYVWLDFGSEDSRRALPPALRELCVRLAGIPDALEKVGRSGADRSRVPQLRVDARVMAATYRPGAQYNVHRDSDGTNNARTLTVLLYLNPRAWSPGDGGELRVHRAVTNEQGAPRPNLNEFIDIAPFNGRMVVFRSRDVWHAVREPVQQRWALTLWVHA